MKLLSTVCIFLALVAVSYSQYQENCQAPAFTGVCSGINAGNLNISSTIAGFLPQLEQALGSALSAWKSTIQQVANNNGFQVCEDCITALSNVVCTSFTPACGFLQCAANLGQQVQACQSQCQSECATATSQSCYLCVSSCVSDLFSTNCAKFLMSREMCTSFVNTCACNPGASIVNEACQYFPVNGFTVDFPGTLSCTGVNGWCDVKSSNQPGVMKINNYLSLAVPQSTNQQGQSLNPVIADTTNNNSGFVVVPFLLLSILSLLF